MGELAPHVSKKDQIVSLYQLRVQSIEEIAMLTRARPSYIASVLREAHVLKGYFDLYTSSAWPMNVYAKYFTKKLGFKDEATARRSLAYIETLYEQFGRIGDRAGQHHALLVALTLRNRAHWSDKTKEAALFTAWLIQQLDTASSTVPPSHKMIATIKAHTTPARLTSSTAKRHA